MCMFNSPSVPAPTPIPPTLDQSGIQARVDIDEGDRRRRAAAMGRASTILTGAQGTTSPTTQGKTLLGM